MDPAPQYRVGRLVHGVINGGGHEARIELAQAIDPARLPDHFSCPDSVVIELRLLWKRPGGMPAFYRLAQQVEEQWVRY